MTKNVKRLALWVVFCLVISIVFVSCNANNVTDADTTISEETTVTETSENVTTESDTSATTAEDTTTVVSSVETSAEITETESEEQTTTEETSVEATETESVATTEETSAEVTETESVADTTEETSAEATETESVADTTEETSAEATETESVADTTEETSAEVTETESEVDTTVEETSAEVTETESEVDTTEETTLEVTETESVADTTEETSAEVTETESEEDTTTEEITTEEVTTEEITTEEVTTEPDIMIDEVLNAPYASDFTVSKVFSDDMVVQRGERIRVWGWADPSQNGKKVSGEFMGMFSEAIIENGEWCITFKARLDACADLGNSMKIYTNTKVVEFKDVLVGDVFYVIGQSNVAYSVSANLGVYGNDPSKGGHELIAQYENAPIRLYFNSLAESNEALGYPKKGTDTVVKDVISGNGWKKATSRNVGNFSALGYYTALQVVMATDCKIPVGVIEFDGNGMPLGAFMSNEVAEATKVDAWDEAQGMYICKGVNNTWGSRFIYNHFIAPFSRYAIAGVIWYQGESNFSDAFGANTFANDFAALMTYMRSTQNVTNPNFPVFVMEFPSIYNRPSGYTSDWHFMDLGKIRGVVGSIPMVLENSYVSVSCDLWNDRTFYNNLHPNCKYDQAGRMAKLILAVCDKSLEMEKATGPIVESVTIESNGQVITIKFKNVGDGLKTSDGENVVKGFYGIRKNRTQISLVTVKAMITSEDTITVIAGSKLSGVAYNIDAENFYGIDVTLCNSNNMPASAFWIIPE